jgi:hypothetical protein
VHRGLVRLGCGVLWVRRITVHQFGGWWLVGAAVVTRRELFMGWFGRSGILLKTRLRQSGTLRRGVPSFKLRECPPQA